MCTSYAFCLWSLAPILNKGTQFYSLETSVLVSLVSHYDTTLYHIIEYGCKNSVLVRNVFFQRVAASDAASCRSTSCVINSSAMYLAVHGLLGCVLICHVFVPVLCVASWCVCVVRFIQGRIFALCVPRQRWVLWGTCRGVSAVASPTLAQPTCPRYP